MAKSSGNKGSGSKNAPSYPENKPSTTGEKSGGGRSNNTPGGGKK